MTHELKPLLYIAAPLFNEAERAFNLRLDALASSIGFRTFLPQREAGEAMQLIDAGEQPEIVRPRLFDLDWRHVQTCDLFLMVLDGRVPDEGACVELGMAYALGKRAVGFQTDSRRFARAFNNIMVEGALEEIVHSWHDLERMLIARL